jgi:hypothetical protein
MAAELLTGLGIFKTLLDSAKGLKDINDAAVRNGAIVELQEKILTAQEQQAALVQRVRDLEKVVAEFEAWDREKERYQLTDFGGGTFAYVLKPAMADGEPAHRICAHCYEQRRKGLLQSDGTTGSGREKVICHSCKSTFMLGAVGPLPTRSVNPNRGGRSGWTG